MGTEWNSPQSPAGRDPRALDQGVLTISLDMELIWGTLDLYGPQRFHESCLLAREAIERLLALFVEFEVSATWCVLGHLFLDRCEAVDGCRHPEIIRGGQTANGLDWFEHDRGGDEVTGPTFYARSLVEQIRDCAVPQEIGSHTFSHVIFGDPGLSREAAESELAECVRLADEMGISLQSLAFPRNSIGHLDVLREQGFTCYRGPDETWAERRGLPGKLKRLMNLASVLLATTPPVVTPTLTESGLWNVPGSMTYFPLHGLRRYVPMWLRVRRMIKGLEKAAASKKVFHFWFHPMNLAEDTERTLGGVRQLFERAAFLRQQGRLAILPMRDVVAHYCDDDKETTDSLPLEAGVDRREGATATP